MHIAHLHIQNNFSLAGASIGLGGMDAPAHRCCEPTTQDYNVNLMSFKRSAKSKKSQVTHCCLSE